MLRNAITLVVLGLLASLALDGVSGATPTAARQRIVITVTILPGAAPNGTFKLTALQAGPVRTDSGSVTSVDRGETKGVRDGQAFAHYPRTTATFAGKKGTLVLREDQYIVSAGTGVDVDTGTWIVVSGKRAYAGMTGKGRQASVFSLKATSPYPIRYEGVLTSS